MRHLYSSIQLCFPQVLRDFVTTPISQNTINMYFLICTYLLHLNNTCLTVSQPPHTSHIPFRCFPTKCTPTPKAVSLVPDTSLLLPMYCSGYSVRKWWSHSQPVNLKAASPMSPGVLLMKARAQNDMWWPKLDVDMEIYS